MKRAIALLLVIMMSFGWASPALGDCCDSLFGCAAAYVTDGLSCVVEELIGTVKNLITMMSDLSSRVSGATQQASDHARKYVSDTIAETSDEALLSSQETAAALERAKAIYQEEASPSGYADHSTKLNSAPAAVASSTPTTSAASSKPVKPSGPVTAAQSNVHPGALAATAASKSSQGKTPSNAQKINGSAPQQSVSAPTTAKPPQTNTPNNAQKINGSVPPAAVSATGNFAPHAALKGLFEKSIAEIQRLKTANDRDLPKVNQLMTQAKQSEGPAVDSALAVADKAINEPIRQILDRLKSMLSDPTNIYDPSDIVNSVANSVLNNLDTNIGQMVQTITQGPQKAFDAAQPLQDELIGNAHRAHEIAAAMQAAYTQRTPASEIALSKLLPLPAVVSSSNTEAKIVAPGGYSSYSQTLSRFKNNKQTIAPAAKQRMQAIVPALTKFKELRNRALAVRSAAPTYKTNFTQKLNAAFVNKTQAEINSQRDQLIAQARAQYANDPKTRDKLIALFTSETSKIRAVPKH